MNLTVGAFIVYRVDESFHYILVHNLYLMCPMKTYFFLFESEAFIVYGEGANFLVPYFNRRLLHRILSKLKSFHSTE